MITRRSLIQKTFGAGVLSLIPLKSAFSIEPIRQKLIIIPDPLELIYKRIIKYKRDDYILCMEVVKLDSTELYIGCMYSYGHKIPTLREFGDGIYSIKKVIYNKDSNIHVSLRDYKFYWYNPINQVCKIHIDMTGIIQKPKFIFSNSN
jgi:hypothetical protein